MNIPFRIKLLTKTAKAPHRNCESDLWDLFADDFDFENLEDLLSNHPQWIQNLSEDDEGEYVEKYSKLSAEEKIEGIILHPRGRILVKTGIAIELPKQIKNIGSYGKREPWIYGDLEYYTNYPDESLIAYAVADIRPRSGLALKHGITVLNSPGTIDNSYRKEIGVILYNAGHEPYTIRKGDKIAQMLIRPLYPSSFEIVEDFEDTGRCGYGSTGR